MREKSSNATKLRPRVLFVNRSYWPDGEATGQLLTELTEDLVSRFDVSVIAGQPNSNPSNEHFRSWRTESRNGVSIIRVPHTRFPKKWLTARALNFLTFLILAMMRGLFCRRQDIVIVETDPFLLSLVGRVLRLRHGGAFVVYLQDIHPDLGIAIGKIQENWITRCLQQLLRASYRAADCVIVLSEDMKRTVRKYGVRDEAVVEIPNWIDTQQVVPTLRAPNFVTNAPANSFVVMYSGNLGLTQQLECLIESANLLRDCPGIRFVIVGNGSAEETLRRQVAERLLSNVTFLPFQPKEILGESLSAADLHLITVHPAALDYLMPSKLYGILSVGRPILAAVPENSELAQLVREHRLGYVVQPGDAEAMATAIRQAVSLKDELQAAGARARELAVSEYDRRKITQNFGDLLDELLAASSAEKKAPSVAGLC